MSSPPARRPKRWVWFFLLLGTLAAAGVGIEVWSNLQQQLTPQKLALARSLWAEKGPRDYELVYEVKHGDVPDPAPRGGETYTVRVKDRKAVTAPRTGEFGSMDELFDWIDARQRADREPGSPRAFVKPTFDPADGHVEHYVRSVMATRERIEIDVKLRPLTSSGGPVSPTP